MKNPNANDKHLKNAINGIFVSIKNNITLKIQFLMALAVIVAGFVFGINKVEWLSIIICIASVICLELMNSAIEIWLDEFHPEYNKNTGLVKDIFAGMVLIASIMASVIGIIIFLPYFIKLF